MEVLHQKLPIVEAWVEQMVINHAGNARPLASFGFPRLPNFYPASFLQHTKVVVLPEVPVPPLKLIGLSGFEDFEQMVPDGITYLDTYFIREDAKGRESLHFHELVHVVQWMHLGPTNFILAYVLGHLLGGGYRGNPMEEAAYAMQARFETYDPGFDVVSEVKGLAERDFWNAIQRAGMA